MRYTPAIEIGRSLTKHWNWGFHISKQSHILNIYPEPSPVLRRYLKPTFLRLGAVVKTWPLCLQMARVRYLFLRSIIGFTK